MDRRRFLLTSLAGALAVPLAAGAQAGKVWRIGYLYPGADPGRAAGDATPTRQAFWRELRELGFVVGENVMEDRRYAEGQPNRLPTLAADLVQRRVDVIVALTTPVVKAAKQETTSIPIVMVNVGDPVGDGLIASLAQPGGNVTGTVLPLLGINSKLLQLVKECLPNARRLAIVIEPQSQPGRRHGLRLQDDARRFGIDVDIVEVKDGEDLERQAQAMKAKRTDIVWFQTSVFRGGDPRVVKFAVRHGLPTVHESRVAVEHGGFMSYGESDLVRWRRVARYVARILQGAQPRDLPAEESTHIELTINLTTAKALGLTIPPSVLARADQVIE